MTVQLVHFCDISYYFGALSRHDVTPYSPLEMYLMSDLQPSLGNWFHYTDNVFYTVSKLK